DQHHPRRAEPALQAVHLLEALLDRVELTVLVEALDGDDAAAVGLDREQRARLHRRAVEQDRARAAAARVAADVGPGQLQRAADEMDEQRARLDVGREFDAVDGGGRIHVCPHARACSSGVVRARRVKTRTTLRLNSTEPRTSSFGWAARAVSSAASANRASLGAWPTSARSASGP